MDEPLNGTEKSELLERARRVGAGALGMSQPGPALAESAGRLAEPGAAFVTWTREGRLRGCIGSVEPVRPLALDVESNAVAALLRDPRFPPATPKEFPRYRVEISVLTPPERITSPDDVEIGVHGLIVEKGRRRGLLLPQVAVEWKWGAETFLSQCCLKSGLPEDAWKKSDPAFGIWRFSAEVFHEKE